MQIEEYAEHLEFLGYKLDRIDGIAASHERFPNVKILEKGGGLLMVAWFGVKEEAVAEAMNYANSLNQQAVATRYLIDGDGDFAMEGWVPGEYSRNTFATFMELWHRDWMLVQGHERSSDILA